jgi:hypothetical protein
MLPRCTEPEMRQAHQLQFSTIRRRRLTIAVRIKETTRRVRSRPVLAGNPVDGFATRRRPGSPRTMVRDQSDGQLLVADLPT